MPPRRRGGIPHVAAAHMPADDTYPLLIAGVMNASLRLPLFGAQGERVTQLALDRSHI